ncbi:unnamed protein product [Dibothriocephalus latus]|uniref:Uncharacterized protein n=1 Tax=Dibothriocephalus latus TaxID=60516 RepID=A0A3P7LU23_DIBLA|nr:unnamed protein product [Dibothriocephalus latus]
MRLRWKGLDIDSVHPPIESILREFVPGRRADLEALQEVFLSVLLAPLLSPFAESIHGDIAMEHMLGIISLENFSADTFTGFFNFLAIYAGLDSNEDHEGNSKPQAADVLLGAIVSCTGVHCNCKELQLISGFPKVPYSLSGG